MAKILILGDVLRDEDRRKGSPVPGYILEGLLAQAGISPSECEFDVVFQTDSSFHTLCTSDGAQASSLVGRYQHSPKLFLHQAHDHHILRIRERIAALQPNIILALGDVPLWALTGKTSIGKNRGAPMLGGGRKLIATYHPSSVVKNWSLRPIVLLDLMKAKRHSETPELVRPSRTLHLFPSLADIEEFYEKYIIPAPVLSVDVETKAGQITEVGIATSRDRALVIPFWARSERDGNYWRTLREESLAWKWVRRILSEKACIGQNFSYDIQYFYRVMHIPVPHFVGDTMLLHHAMQPEMEKGLGFLGSIYTDEPAWKFMRTDAATLKKED